MFCREFASLSVRAASVKPYGAPTTTHGKDFGWFGSTLPDGYLERKTARVHFLPFLGGPTREALLNVARRTTGATWRLAIRRAFMVNSSRCSIVSALKSAFCGDPWRVDAQRVFFVSGR